MTLTLILTRHAKSAWDDPLAHDHDRVLNARGRRSADALGPWIAARARPGEVLVSSAARTQETWARIQPALGPVEEVRVLQGLYNAGPSKLREVLRTATAPVVMMIAHNTGIAEFAQRFAQRAPDHPRFPDYPTGATTIFRIDAPDWSGVEFGDGIVTDFVVPRDLTD